METSPFLSADNLDHRDGGYRAAAGDRTVAEPTLPFEAKNFADLAHGSSLLGVRSHPP